MDFGPCCSRILLSGKGDTCPFDWNFLFICEHLHGHGIRQETECGGEMGEEIHFHML